MSFRDAFDIPRSLSNAWKLIARAPGPILVGGILLLLVGGFGGGGSGWRMDGRAARDLWPLFFGLFGFTCLVGIGLFLLASWIQLGWLRALEETARAGRTDFGTVFGGGDRWLAMALVRFLVALLAALSAAPLVAIALVAVGLHELLELPEPLAAAFGVIGCLLYLPVVFYVALGVVLSPYALAFEGLEPVDALKRSWSLAQGNRLWLLLYALVMAVLAMLGFLACCVGIFFTATWAHVAWSESYLALIRPEEHARWWINARAGGPATPEAPAGTPSEPQAPPPPGIA